MKILVLLVVLFIGCVHETIPEAPYVDDTTWPAIKIDTIIQIDTFVVQVEDSLLTYESYYIITIGDSVKVGRSTWKAK